MFYVKSERVECVGIRFCVSLLRRLHCVQVSFGCEYSTVAGFRVEICGYMVLRCPKPVSHSGRWWIIRATRRLHPVVRISSWFESSLRLVVSTTKSETFGQNLPAVSDMTK